MYFLLKGCSGGSPRNAFAYIENAGGLDTENSYPYKHGKKGKCNFNRNHIGARVTGFKKIPSHNENALKQAVATLVNIYMMIYCWISESSTLTAGLVHLRAKCLNIFMH